MKINIITARRSIWFSCKDVYTHVEVPKAHPTSMFWLFYHLLVAKQARKYCNTQMLFLWYEDYLNGILE